MSALPAEAMLSRDEARSLTDEVKEDAERLWRKLAELYEGGAHEVLGYSSWGAYFKSEFGGTERRGYQLLEAGRVMETLAPVQNFALPANDSQARALAPLLDKPEKLREAWSEVVESNPTPTAREVRDVVQQKITKDDLAGPAKPDPRQPIPTVKSAAREVVRVAVREGAAYRVPLAAMNALILAIGKAD